MSLLFIRSIESGFRRTFGFKTKSCLTLKMVLYFFFLKLSFKFVTKYVYLAYLHSNSMNINIRKTKKINNKALMKTE